jgi:hypothetical protein
MMRISKLVIFSGCVLFFTLVSAGAALSSPPAPRVDVKISTDEAEAVLAILDQTSVGRTVGSELWNRLFSSEPYARLKKREAEIGLRFNAPELKFTDEDFKKFVLSDDLRKRAPELKQTLNKWKEADLSAAGTRVLSYLPAEARIRAKVFPVIKPGKNSFVYELGTDPTIFLYLDPDLTQAQFENTVAHEMHHIGYSSLDPQVQKMKSALPPEVRTAVEWIAAFGEGFAMLAAAGGPDIHPHAASPAETRARWDRDMGKFNPDLKDVEKFLLDILQGRFKIEAEITEKGSIFYGIQGPWYTVGYKMAVMVEKNFGRTKLIQCMLDPRLLLLNYDLAAAEYNRGHKDHLALWSPDLLKCLGLDSVAKN